VSPRVLVPRLGLFCRLYKPCMCPCMHGLLVKALLALTSDNTRAHAEAPPVQPQHQAHELLHSSTSTPVLVCPFSDALQGFVEARRQLRPPVCPTWPCNIVSVQQWARSSPTGPVTAARSCRGTQHGPTYLNTGSTTGCKPNSNSNVVMAKPRSPSPSREPSAPSSGPEDLHGILAEQRACIA
jgi:hypothetical protein